MSLSHEPPSPLPPHPALLDCHRALVWVSWDIQQIPIDYLFYGNVSFHVTLSIHLTLSLLPSPRVHRSILYVCFSIAALQINSSEPSFKIPYICISIWYLSFSFWLTALCIISSRFIHLIRTDSNVFLFMTELYSIVYMYHNFFICSSVNGHLGYVCLFQFWFPQGICLGVGLLGHMVVLVLVC